MKVLAPVAVAVLLVVLGLPTVAGGTEANPGIGVVFDIRTFSDGGDPGRIDDRFEGGPTWDKPCEFDNEVTGATQRLTISEPDTCKPHTDGAPRAGSVPMSRTFAAAAGEAYLSYAYARVQGPRGAFVAQVHLVARNGSGILRDCGGGSSAVGQPTADFVRLDTGVCVLPSGTSAVTVEFAAVARAAGASGTAVLQRFQLLRCASPSASCPTTVSTTAPPTTSPAPSTTEVPQPPSAGGGGGGVVDPGTGGPSVSETTLPGVTAVPPPTATATSEPQRRGSETLRPIAGARRDGGGNNGTFLLVVALLAVAVAVGTAAGWWAWRRE